MAVIHVIHYLVKFSQTEFGTDPGVHVSREQKQLHACALHPTLYAKLMPQPPRQSDLISPSRFLLPVAMVKEEQGWCDISRDECISSHESQRSWITPPHQGSILHAHDTGAKAEKASGVYKASYINVTH